MILETLETIVILHQRNIDVECIKTAEKRENESEDLTML